MSSKSEEPLDARLIKFFSGVVKEASELKSYIIADVSRLEDFVRRVREAYGTCYTAYILRVVFNFKTSFVAKIMGLKPSGVRACLSWARKRGIGEPALPLEEYVFKGETYRKACTEPLSLECQLIEAERFAYAVAKEALPTNVLWNIAIWIRATHRTIFPEVYALLRLIEDIERKPLLRAYRWGDKWVVGDGVAVYTYILLAKVLEEGGYYFTDRDTNVRLTILKMTGVNVQEIGGLPLMLATLVGSLVAKKRFDIRRKRDEILEAIVRDRKLLSTTGREIGEVKEPREDFNPAEFRRMVMEA